MPLTQFQYNKISTHKIQFESNGHLTPVSVVDFILVKFQAQKCIGTSYDDLSNTDSTIQTS